MKDLDNYIDELFKQQFSGTEAKLPSQGSDWTRLQKTIRKKNFLRFTSNSFNIYYLIGIAGIVATLSVIFLPSFLHKPKENMENKPFSIEMADTIPAVDTTQNIPPVKPVTHSPCLNAQPKPDCKNKTKPDTIAQPCSNTVIKETPKNKEQEKEIIKEENDSLSIPIKSSPSFNPEPNSSLDTLKQVDTILISKKKIQFSRKKR
jgi:hypothetical protein